MRGLIGTKPQFSACFGFSMYLRKAGGLEKINMLGFHGLGMSGGERGQGLCGTESTASHRWHLKLYSKILDRQQIAEQLVVMYILLCQR